MKIILQMLAITAIVLVSRQVCVAIAILLIKADLTWNWVIWPAGLLYLAISVSGSVWSVKYINRLFDSTAS